jgi:hypothetical protein
MAFNEFIPIESIAYNSPFLPGSLLYSPYSSTWYTGHSAEPGTKDPNSNHVTLDDMQVMNDTS